MELDVGGVGRMWESGRRPRGAVLPSAAVLSKIGPHPDSVPTAEDVSDVRSHQPRRCPAMKRSETGSGLAQPRGPSTDQETAQRQLDLFAERGGVEPRHSPRTAASSATAPAVGTLSDDDLLELIPNAGSSNVEAVCAEVVSRSLRTAVPALEALWRRFSGFGIEKPLPEQLAVIDTLARLGGTDARAALKGIVLSKGLPASLLPAALEAATSAGLALPASFVGPLLDHEGAAVRGAAFALAASAHVPAERLHTSLFDRSAADRRAAAVALGLRGDSRARQPLFDELQRSPSPDVIEAVAAVWDDDAIVHLGRCARHHPRLAGAVLDALRDIGSPRAKVVARKLETHAGSSTLGGE